MQYSKASFAAFAMVPETVKNVAKQISTFLKSKGIPHAVIGGVAVSAYSSPRTTKDVDFLIPESHSDIAYELDPNPTVVSGMHLQGLGVDVEGNQVDLMFLPDDLPEEILSSGPVIDGVPILAVEALVLLKIKAGRAKDIADVVEILKARKEDSTSLKKYVKRYAPDALEDFESITILADYESGKFEDIKNKGAKSRKATLNHILKKYETRNH